MYIGEFKGSCLSLDLNQAWQLAVVHMWGQQASPKHAEWLSSVAHQPYHSHFYTVRAMHISTLWVDPCVSLLSWKTLPHELSLLCGFNYNLSLTQHTCLDNGVLFRPKVLGVLAPEDRTLCLKEFGQLGRISECSDRLVLSRESGREKPTTMGYTYTTL